MPTVILNHTVSHLWPVQYLPYQTHTHIQLHSHLSLIYTGTWTGVTHSALQCRGILLTHHLGSPGAPNYLSLSGRRIHPNFHTVNLASFQFWRNGLFPSARNKTLSNHRLSGPRGSWEHPIPTSWQEAPGKLHNRPLSSCLHISCQGARSLQRPSPPLLGKL